MAKRLVEHQFTGETTASTAYDPNKTVLGSLLRQYNFSQADPNKTWAAIVSDSDGSNLFVSLSNGRVYTSKDGGEHWTERRPIDTPISPITGNQPAIGTDADGSNLITGFKDGRLYTSSNGGESWTERQPADITTGYNKKWSSVASSADGSRLVASLASGRVFTSADSGATWTERFPAGALTPMWVACGDGSYSLIYSADGITWTGSTNGKSIFTTYGLTVAWNGSIWVAGGEGTNRLAYSLDGITWTASTNGNSIFSNQCWTVCWNGTMWVASGYGTNTLAYSYNGINWVASANGNTIFSSYCYSVAWNGTMWVAGGSGTNRIGYSYDGITWAASANGNTIFSSNCYAVAWNGALWVAGGYGTNVLAYSHDGINWTGSANGNSVMGGQCWAICWNGVRWVAGGGDTNVNRLIYSSDGITWTASANGTDLFSFGTMVYGLAWDGAIFVANGTGENHLAYSSDGITWSASANGGSILNSYGMRVGSNLSPKLNQEPNYFWTSLSSDSDGSNLISCIKTGRLYTSTDYGATWTERRPAGDVNKLWRVASDADGSNLIVGCSSGRLYTSSNSGVDWTERQPAGDVNHWWTGVASDDDGSHLIAYGDGKVYTSSNSGANWTERQPAGALAPMWVAAGDGVNNLVYSTDGINWVASANGNSVISGWVNFTVYGGWMWVAGGQTTNSLAYSYDGITWIASANGNSILSTQSSTAAWNGSIWVAGGSGTNTLAYSYDGITWIASANGNSIFSSGCMEVAWNGVLWVAGGYGTNRLAYSYDGITWVASANGNSIFSSQCGALAWDGTMWVAGGSGTNTLAYSYDGITWAPSINGNVVFGSYCFSVAWNGIMWVAGGNGTNRLVYSSDGINWTPSVNGNNLFSSQGNTAVWNGIMWVAGGSGTNIFGYSSDGINWSISNGGNGLISPVFKIATNLAPALTLNIPAKQITASDSDGSSLAVSLLAGRTYTSTNSGANWSEKNSAGVTKYVAPFKPAFFNPVNYGNIPGMYPHVISWSSNIDWIFLADAAAVAATRRVSLIEYNKTTSVFTYKGFITIPSTPADNKTIAGLRASYAKYTKGTVDVASYIVTGNETLWLDDRIFAGSRIGFGSTDPAQISTWYEISSIGTNNALYLTSSANSVTIFTTQCASLSWSESKNLWVAGGEGTNTLGYSSDGIHWSISTNGTSIMEGLGWAVANNETIFVAGGNGANRLAYSSDGMTWTASANGNTIFTTNCRAVAWNGDDEMWVAGGNGTNRLAYSYDGDTWVASANGNTIFTSICYGVAWNGTMWVAAGAGTNLLAYSSDGITWTASTNGNSIFTNCFIIAWNGTMWVAGGQGTNTLAYSTDGMTWSASVNGNDIINWVYSIDWNGSIWVAGGTAGTNTLAYSSDGMTWTGSANGNTVANQCRAVSHNSSGWLIGVDGVGTFATSSDGSNWTMVTDAISSNTPYVIEDLRLLLAVSNATATNGGLFMVGGLRYENFIPAGTSVSLASATDKLRVAYWLADRPTVTNIAPAGLAIDDFKTWTEQYCYIINRTGNSTPQIFKYNFRAPLTTIASGKTYDAFVCRTGIQTVTGTVSLTNNGRIGILSHGPGTGQNCLYFVTTTRVYRALLSDIVADSITWIADGMSEIPLGGITTYAATGALTAVEIADTIDRLIITSTGAAGVRSYVTKYQTDGDPFDHIFLIDSKQQDQFLSSPASIPHPNIQAGILNVWSQNGFCYICRTGTTALTNALYVIPLGADWQYANTTIKQRLITPAIATPDALSYSKMYYNQVGYLGEGTLTLPTEPVRAYYRTSGILDNTGEWTPIDQTGDLTGAEGSSKIQFAFEFRTIGSFCLPAQVYNVAVSYEDQTTDSHYQPSVAFSSSANKQFAWRFATGWGESVPELRVRLFDSVSSELLVDDNTTDAVGHWEKTTNNGGLWADYDTDDLETDNGDTYIRYTPVLLGDAVKVRAILTQNI